MATGWLVVEANVAGDPYSLVDGFSISDTYLEVGSHLARHEHWRLALLPKIERLIVTVAARRAGAPGWARHFGPV